MAGLIVFDGGGGAGAAGEGSAAGLSPLTDLRGSFGVRTGAVTTLERVESAWGGRASMVVAGPGLRAVEAERWERDGRRVVGVEQLGEGPAGGGAGAGSDEFVWVDGRWVLPDGEVLRGLGAGERAVDGRTGVVVAARLGWAEGAELVRASADGPAGGGGGGGGSELDAAVLGRCWDVIRWRDAAIAADLARLAREPRREGEVAGVVMGDGPVVVGAGARVWESAVIDATGGPVVIGAGATVRPRATVIGPAFVGEKSSVLDGAVVRAGTAIGPVCKVAGEVSGLVMQGFANKGHEGFVGDTWLGEWVNLGAGTITSNLLNTYGEVTACAASDGRHHHGVRERTGLTFFGSVIGDHVKTAIGTRLMTGSVIGTGSMLAPSGYPPTAVDGFSWVTDGGVRGYRAEKFLGVMRAAMGRRGVEPSGAYASAVRGVAERCLGEGGGG